MGGKRGVLCILGGTTGGFFNAGEGIGTLDCLSPRVSGLGWKWADPLACIRERESTKTDYRQSGRNGIVKPRESKTSGAEEETRS